MLRLAFASQIRHIYTCYMSKIFNLDLKRGGFNKVQVEVLKALMRAGRPLSMRSLEEALDKRRLTIYYNLRELAKRGVVRQDRTGKIYIWALVLEETNTSSTDIPISQAYDVLARSNSQKLWGIQGGAAVRTLISQIKEGATYRPIHHRQRLRQVIVDAILTTSGIEAIKSAPREELASHLHRPTILHVVPDTPELDPLESITDGKVLLLINRAEGKAAVTRDATEIAAYIAMHETVKALATKMRPQEVYGEVD
jgi:hypothetical protein